MIVLEPEDQAARLPATKAGPEEIEVTILPNICTTTAGKPPAPKRQRFNEKMAKVMAYKVAKAEVKRQKKFYRWRNRDRKKCKLSCNSDEIFYNNSAMHKRIVENFQTELKCNICDKKFQWAADLASHNLSDKHIKVARTIQENMNWNPFRGFFIAFSLQIIVINVQFSCISWH